jgi:hypothetical protein
MNQTTWHRMAHRPLRLHMFNHCWSRRSRRTKHFLPGLLGEGRNRYPPHILKADITVAGYSRPFLFKWKWFRVIWYVAVVAGNRSLQPLALNTTRKVTVFFQPAKIASALIIVKSGKVLQWAAYALRFVETRTCFKSSHSENHEGDGIINLR